MNGYTGDGSGAKARVLENVVERFEGDRQAVLFAVRPRAANAWQFLSLYWLLSAGVHRVVKCWVFDYAMTILSARIRQCSTPWLSNWLSTGMLNFCGRDVRPADPESLTEAEAR